MPRTATTPLALAALAATVLPVDPALAQSTLAPVPATTYPAAPYAVAYPPANAPAPVLAPAVETRFPDTAVVISSTPIYQRISEPAQQCRLETYAAPEGDRQVERCYDTTRERQVVRAYSVVYRYGDRQFTAELPYDPGPRLRVDVAVNPVP